jgi:chromosome segregation ATPase
MPDRTATAKRPDAASSATKGPLIEIGTPKTSPAEAKPEADKVSLAEVKRPRASVLQVLGKLKPLLPILSGGLRLVDHGAAQAVAQLLNFASGADTAQSASQEELHHELAEIQSSHREIHLQVQDQTVEMQRIKDQITLLRQTVERNATEHAELVADVKSLGNLIRALGAGLAILLVVLIALTAVLLTRHH